MFKTRTARIWALVIVFFVAAFFLFNKKPVVTDTDKVFIKYFAAEWKLLSQSEVHQNYNKELEFLTKLQDSVVSSLSHEERAEPRFGDVKYYFETRKGACYDRTVLMEKFFDVYGFKYRHLYVYSDPDTLKSTNFIDFFKKKTLSHAVTEVKTSKGWMIMDSNSNSIGLSLTNDPISIRDLLEQLKSPQGVQLKEKVEMGSPFWVHFPNFNFIYGVYSRHGKFLKPNLGVPSVNFRMMLYNFAY